MTGPVPSGRPEHSVAVASRWLESATGIALLFVVLALIWATLTVFWPATFAPFSDEYELAAFLLLVCIALLLACAGGVWQSEAALQSPVAPVARETLVSVSLPELSVHRADPSAPARQPAFPHTTAPVSDPFVTLPER